MAAAFFAPVSLLAGRGSAQSTDAPCDTSYNDLVNCIIVLMRSVTLAFARLGRSSFHRQDMHVQSGSHWRSRSDVVGFCGALRSVAAGAAGATDCLTAGRAQ